MANVATTGNIDIDDEFIDDEFEPLIIPPDAGLDERLRILTVHSENYGKHLAASIAKREQRIRELEQRMNQNAQKAKEQSQKLFSSRDKQTAQPAANITSEFTTLRKEGSILATQVGSQQGELKSQESAREEVVSEVELPTDGDKPKRLTGESQPYTEAAFGEDDPQDCSSDNKVVSEQISEFSTDPAIYVATDQILGGQDGAHVHSVDHQNEFLKNSNSQAVIKYDLGDQIVVFEALDHENSNQQVVVYNGQSVANSMPTKILGGQDYSSYELNFFQFWHAKYLCCFPSSSHKGGFHAINFYASELGVKHRWPPPWPSGG